MLDKIVAALLMISFLIVALMFVIAFLIVAFDKMAHKYVKEQNEIKNVNNVNGV